MPDQQQPTTTISVIQQYTPEKTQALIATLTKYRDVITGDLATIQTVNNDEEYTAANNLLAEAKGFIEKATDKRKAFTDPIKQALTELMVFEHDLDAAYTRARGVLEVYNQAQIKKKQLIEHEAKLKADQIKYKAEFKAEVKKQLADMLAGVHRTVIHKMTEWEGKLTLENIDQMEADLRKSNPALKAEKHQACFHRWGQQPMIMAPSQEDEYLEELKKELTYELYNEEYQKIVAPVKNEYLAKLPAIKTALQQRAAADKATQERLDKEAADKREQDKQAALQVAAKAEENAKIAINDEKDINKTEGDFTQQMMTADLKAPPSKKVASFTSNAAWLGPFLKVVAKVGAHPKFKGIMAKEGYTPAVKAWMTFYGDNIAEPIEGITLTEEAKTIIKAK